MHEASLVQGLLDLALNALATHNAGCPAKKAGKIVEIKCQAGLLACFEANTLRACFEIFSEGTPAEGARLEIETMPLACDCINCGHKFELLKRHFICPSCGSENIAFKGGNGLVLLALNVSEDAEDD